MAKQLRPPFPWHQGEHVTIIGSTGMGKTYLLVRLLSEGPRRYTILVRTKDDDTRLPREFRRTTNPQSLTDPTVERWNFDLVRVQRAGQSERLQKLFQTVWEQRGWTLAVDELFYVYDRLRLGPEIETLLTQGRGMKITVVCGMQRPVRISRFALSESMHVICFGIEGRDRATLAEATSDKLADASMDLPRYHFAWWSRKAREVWTGKVQDLEV